MRSYARFMHNHGLLGVAARTQWRTITGGSRRYVDALTAPFADRIRLGTPGAQDRRPRAIRAATASVELLTDAGPGARSTG